MTDLRYNLADLKAIPIADIAQHLGLQVKRSGSSAVAHCFNSQGHKHGDRNPSLHLRSRTNRFLCYACGVKGSTIDLVMQCKGVDFAAASAELGQVFNLPEGRKPYSRKGSIGPAVPRSSSTGKPKRSNFRQTTPWKPEPSDQAIYEQILELAPIDDKAISYLRKQRGLTDQVITNYRLGHVIPNSKAARGILNTLLVNFRPENLLHSGTVKAKAGTVRLVWWDRTLLIPFLNQGKAVYLQGRRRDDGLSKYVNLAGVPRPLYNLDQVVSTPASEPIYLCEGVFDALAIIAQGKPAVAVLGVSAKDIEALRPLIDHPIIIARQNDQASRQWAKDITDTLAKIGKRNVQALVVPEGSKDISEYLTKQKVNKPVKVTE